MVVIKTAMISNVGTHSVWGARRAEAASRDRDAAELAMTNLSRCNKTARKNITAPSASNITPPP